MHLRFLGTWIGAICLAIAMCVGRPAAAAELLVAPAAASATLAPGQTLVVDGQITNLTGVGLFATDIFLNFSGYPDSALQITQLLGATEFHLPHNTFTSSQLFELQLLPGAVAGDVLLISFYAMDVNGVFSEPQQFSVSVAAIPEPASYLMLVAGLAVVALRRQHRRTCREA